MKTLSLLALGLFSLSTQAAPAADPEQLRVEAVGLIAPFQQQLLGTVKQAMADGGPAQAV